MQEKDALYAKPDFTDEDGDSRGGAGGRICRDGRLGRGIRARRPCSTGWASTEDKHYASKWRNLDGNDKVKVLLAQALFGNPDVHAAGRADQPPGRQGHPTGWSDFLGDFENTVIVVSHDRHFLNEVCTYIADIDYRKIQLYAGNYDFWYESSQLALRQARETNKRNEAKIKELQGLHCALLGQRFQIQAGDQPQKTAR